MLCIFFWGGHYKESMTEPIYGDVAPLGMPENTFSPGDTYHRRTPRNSRIKERLAVIVYVDRTSWHLSGLREEIAWRSDAPFSPTRAEREIAQGLLDAGYALRVERFSNLAMIFLLPTIVPRKLFK